MATTNRDFRVKNGLVVEGTTATVNGVNVVTESSFQTLSNKTLSSPIVTTALTLNETGELRLADTDSSNYVGFKSPGTVSSNKIWTLPSADGTDGQVLSTNGSGTLSWATAGGGTTTNALTIGTGLSGTSFNGSSPVTIAIDSSVATLTGVQEMSNKTLSSAIATTAFTLNSTAEIRFADTDSSNYVGFKAPGTVSSNKIWILPATDGTSGQVLSTDGSGTLSWSTSSGGGSSDPNFTAIHLLGGM